MTLVAWIFALLAAVVHLLVFVWEALLFTRPGVHQGIFFVPTADLPAVRLWAFGVGFDKLFLGCGMVAGVIAWIAGEEVVGRALIIYLCLFMFSSGLVLLLADRLEFGRARGKGLGGAAAPQSLPPLIVLIAAVL